MYSSWGLKIETWKRILAGEALLRKFFSKIFSKVFFCHALLRHKKKNALNNGGKAPKNG